jgi:hypothetical protein
VPSVWIDASGGETKTSRTEKGTKMIVGIDFGQSNAAAFTEESAIQLQRTVGQYSYMLPPIIGIDTWHLMRPSRTKLVTELFWLRGNKTKNKDTIISLACDAYIAFGRLTEMYGVHGYVLPVDVWKGLLFDGGRKDKLVHSRLIRKLLIPSERALLPEGPRMWDALSAIGIAWAACLLRQKLEGYQRC